MRYYDFIIGVIGLGYVGLPLAIEFSKKFQTVAVDINSNKISKIKIGIDPIGQLTGDDFKSAGSITYSDAFDKIQNCDVIIIAVPTPVDNNKIPDFSALLNASTLVGNHMKKGAIVVYESTVAPGTTENMCVPALEAASGYTWKIDFNVGYSPERVSPGDGNKTIKNIVKVISGDTEKTAKIIKEVYDEIITAGTFEASSIKVAEASKIIENIQRDVNIALINELAIVLDKLNIKTKDVLDAANTKWNFLPFVPGLVGGHCIAVDPYYFIEKSVEIGIDVSLIKRARERNESMPAIVAEKVIQFGQSKGLMNENFNVIILGVTFKENCADIRNSKSIDLIQLLTEKGVNVTANDPLLEMSKDQNCPEISLTAWNEIANQNHLVLVSVPHQEYLDIGVEKICELLHEEGALFDVKSAFDENKVKAMNVKYLCL